MSGKPGTVPPGDDEAARPAAAPGGEAAPAPLRLLEAALFAAAAPLAAETLHSLLPEGADLAALLADLAALYAGRGVELVEVAGGWQFRTAPDLAPHLRRVVHAPRRLSRAALETLVIIAYHQPVTRAEIEAIRGVSLAQATFDALLEAGLITPAGRKETPGRPVLWATTQTFLERFGLSALTDLPKREELLIEANAALFAETDPSFPLAAAAGEGNGEGEGAEEG